MTFEEQIRSFATRARKLQESVSTEEATKTSLIMPFFQILGYDVFNPEEFIPEFTADVGIKKGEKVDYAILINGEPVILVECKSINEDLKKHGSQLFRYFATTQSKFGILTNGIIYRFYTDIDESNKMDKAPFLEINLLNIKDYQLIELQKFTKENFDKTAIFDIAADLKYMNQIREIVKDEIANPSDDLVRLFLNRDIYTGVKTQSVVERYQPLVKRAISLVITEMINDRLKSAISSSEDSAEDVPSAESAEKTEPVSKIITTPEELSCFYIVKAILRTKLDSCRITYSDKETYFAINLDNKTTKWICRIYIKDKAQYIIIKENNRSVRYDLKTIDDIYQLSTQLLTRLDELMK